MWSKKIVNTDTSGQKSLEALILERACQDPAWALRMATELTKVGESELIRLQSQLQATKERDQYYESFLRLP